MNGMSTLCHQVQNAHVIRTQRPHDINNAPESVVLVLEALLEWRG